MHVCRLKDVPKGGKFIFEQDHDEYRRFETESDNPATYMRVEFDKACVVRAMRACVPIVCIDWHNTAPIGIVRFVPETTTVMVRSRVSH